MINGLKACPFCGCKYISRSQGGGGDERSGYNFSRYVTCDDCGATIVAHSKRGKNGWCDDSDSRVRDAADQLWNTRVEVDIFPNSISAGLQARDAALAEDPNDQISAFTDGVAAFLKASKLG